MGGDVGGCFVVSVDVASLRASMLCKSLLTTLICCKFSRLNRGTNVAHMTHGPLVFAWQSVQDCAASSMLSPSIAAQLAQVPERAMWHAGQLMLQKVVECMVM